MFASLNCIHRIRKNFTPAHREILTEWVAALRSGNYRQGRATLVCRDAHNANAKRYCCLGVLCDITATRFGLTEGMNHILGFFWSDEHNEALFEVSALPDPVAAIFSGDSNPLLIDETGMLRFASSLNDNFKYTFERIADAIERTYLNPLPFGMITND